MLSRFKSTAFALGFIVRAAPGLAAGFWGLLALRALVPAAVVLAVGRLAAARMMLVADAETSVNDFDELMWWVLANLDRTATSGSRRGVCQK